MKFSSLKINIEIVLRPIIPDDNVLLSVEFFTKLK